MKKYIYHRGIRCRIRPEHPNSYKLQLQRQVLFIWISIAGEWMSVHDGFWGNPIDDTYARRYGYKSEAWPEGTLDLEERARLFIDHYLDMKAEAKAFIEHFKEI